MGEDKDREEEISLDTQGDVELCRNDPEKGYQALNLNHYATKKSAAQSMLDVALLMANSSQLKTLLYRTHEAEWLNVLLSTYRFHGYMSTVKYDLNDTRKHAKLNKMNNFATIFVFFTVLINIFITALGFHEETLG
ncbi:Ninjurin-1 [Merluccius polli]|uniref:Ninjurin-1 n=1 Tax=Merluccius polli TaxID=89951 RepID=A0AA47MRX2_MERPO|nr:Ninjurin-1 [Merluccius polli]